MTRIGVFETCSSISMDLFVVSGSGLLAVGAMVHYMAGQKESQAKMIQKTPSRKVRSLQRSLILLIIWRIRRQPVYLYT